MLLQKVKAGVIIKNKRQKIATGAEVITHSDVVQAKREAEEEKKKQNTVKQAKGQIKRENQMKKIKKEQKINEKIIEVQRRQFYDLTKLSAISRNDSQMLPFIAKQTCDLPSCLRKEIPDNHKIQILSDIIVKKPSEPYNAENIVSAVPTPSELNKKKVNRMRNKNGTA
ncbi:hypothetical protein EVAR_5945_1 [Eumeta japonica]|uniref:Uncharacterized protein n=1 Tax=Eumeta variegata TaxID=151549 RepID=A0A4C1TC69_EUMVA|nr:hypothetical protein EVAR_5945_1 [Eumeta japonica]